MNDRLRRVEVRFAALLLVWLAACREEPAPRSPLPRSEAAITNRIELSSAVVANLGITFERAVRGRVGVWIDVSGELEVPDHGRWTLRAPARGRVRHVAERWRRVAAGDEVVRLDGTSMSDARRAIELAQRAAELARERERRADLRLAECEENRLELEHLERSARERLASLEALGEQGNALTARERLEARRFVSEAAAARLDAAVRRDELAALVAEQRLEAERADALVSAELAALALLTGLSPEELSRDEGGVPPWRRLLDLRVATPAQGVVVAVHVAAGELVDAGTPLLEILDPRELRFRGHLPEGDLGKLSAGDLVRLALPRGGRDDLETRLGDPIPVADPETRMIHVEAVVPNADGSWVHGTSVLARVRIAESAQDEVLVPARCVVFDEIEAIVFRRDPARPDVVVRTPVEIGARGGGWVEVLSGVLDGDEVVADGVHPLKQTGLGKAPVGGHFHADGTWHAGDE